MRKWVKYAVPVVCVVLVGTLTQPAQAFPGGRVLKATGRALAAPVRVVRALRETRGRCLLTGRCRACSGLPDCGPACAAEETSTPETPPSDPRGRLEAP
jgi:hypothetical protein